MADVRTMAGAGGTYAWRSFGAGPPLLLLNGYAATGADWDPTFLAALGRTHTVISPDHRGMGGSTLGEEPLTVALMASDAVALLDHLGLQRAVVAGWSMGGMVAQTLAATSPERVAALVLLSTDPGPGAVRADPAARARLVDRSGTPREQASRLIGLLFPPAVSPVIDREFGDVVTAARAALDPAALDAQQRALDAWSGAGGGVRVPAGIRVLVAAGEEDEIVPAANVALLADRPLAWSARFPGVGHAMMAQVPDALAELVAAFVRAG